MLILFEVRVVSNHSYYLAMTQYIRTLAGIDSLATYIRSDCCFLTYIVIL